MTGDTECTGVMNGEGFIMMQGTQKVKSEGAVKKYGYKLSDEDMISLLHDLEVKAEHVEMKDDKAAAGATAMTIKIPSRLAATMGAAQQALKRMENRGDYMKAIGDVNETQSLLDVLILLAMDMGANAMADVIKAQDNDLKYKGWGTPKQKPSGTPLEQALTSMMKEDGSLKNAGEIDKESLMDALKEKELRTMKADLKARLEKETGYSDDCDCENCKKTRELLEDLEGTMEMMNSLMKDKAKEEANDLNKMYI